MSAVQAEGTASNVSAGAGGISEFRCGKGLCGAGFGRKNGRRCKICGYVYEGEELPPDYVCPLCKHGAADFERIE
ncbi:rubredoxin-like domain-containing protein [Pyramidobacter piscolens]|uniref:rubredoxin-like domain-containing protein n=1 Tax=Pyramidobacter piscolens TaxID=638849 RepID=UPI0034A02C93